MNKLVVFLGPTLPRAEAEQRLEADYRPPAAQGDVLRAVYGGAEVIAIIDGVFELVPAIWHKEILLALEEGVRVYGASSMGALRAAELATFGMIGVGEVFDAYYKGLIEDDDEVAVSHASAEADYRRSSEAMVDIRHACVEACKEGLLAEATSARLIEIAKRLYFPERTYPRILELARAESVPAGELDAFAALVQRRRPSLKANDAIALLEHLAQVKTAAPLPAVRVERTIFFRRLQYEVSEGARALEPARRRAALERALLRMLAREIGRRDGRSATDEQAQAAADDFRRERGLHTRADTLAWLRSHGIREADFQGAMEDRALVNLFIDGSLSRLVDDFRTELALDARDYD